MMSAVIGADNRHDQQGDHEPVRRVHQAGGAPEARRGVIAPRQYTRSPANRAAGKCHTRMAMSPNPGEEVARKRYAG